LGKFLDRFPNAVVGTAARIGQLQYQSQQDRDKVISFIQKYQDRILYGSDMGARPESQIEERYRWVRGRWLLDWKYFATDEVIAVSELDEPVKGLALSKQVVDKIYRINAYKLFPKSWGNKLVAPLDK
jgi:predicted TIM-barrel fold metal-dependent hydrolase